jgi:ABC-type bacteriocin/lantibiotic exporter with double-glycine peptidase domain
MGNFTARVIFLVIFLGFLVFVGWVFTVTGSAWAFALLVFTPTITLSTKSKTKNIESKKDETKFLKDE